MKFILFLRFAPFLLILLIPLGAVAIAAGVDLFGAIAGIIVVVFGIFIVMLATVFGVFVSIGAIGIIFFKALLIIFTVLLLISVISKKPIRSGTSR